MSVDMDESHHNPSSHHFSNIEILPKEVGNVEIEGRYAVMYIMFYACYLLLNPYSDHGAASSTLPDTVNQGKLV